MKHALAWVRNLPQTRVLWAGLAAGLVLVYLRGLFLDLMDVDASQYASISMEMLQNGHWLQVQHRHADYLDKPPLLFWTSAMSFALFGLHNWAYKLPSFLGAAAAVYAVYRFCLLFYSRQTARFAAFILAACAGTLLLCNDVRTDTLLMGCTACTVWLLASAIQALGKGPSREGEADSRSGKNYYSLTRILWGGAFAGLAMLAKGPIGLIVPAFAVGAHLLLRRDWRSLFNWRWLAGLSVAALVLAPMCWGLYQQFDLHPEKTVNQRTGVSGLYFYFWEQSFGRITGENVWKNDTSAFYFLHVYLWAFLPWALLLTGALWRRFGELFRQKFRLPEGEEAYSIGAFTLAFIALSLSKYKLPHYIFVTLPWAAILTARWLTAAVRENKRTGGWRYVQLFVFILLATASGLLLGFVFPTANPLKWGIALTLIGGALLFSWNYRYRKDADAAVSGGVLTFLGVAFVLNFHFYPNLLPYQSTAAVPRYARQHNIPVEKLAFFNRHGHALDFYAGQILAEMKTPEQIRSAASSQGDFWLYTDAPGLAKLDSAGVAYTQTASFPHFQVALLKPAFLNPARRAETLQPVYLLKILSEQKQ